MRNLNQENITEAVIRSFDGAPNARLKDILSNLVSHLHAFAREVQLTEEEWTQGIEFLTRCGHITDEKRQEFILLSDVLGLSMLTVAMNNEKSAGCTESTVFGPFHVSDAPHYELGADISNGARGTSCLVRGVIRGLDGKPVPEAEIDVWQSDEDGLYDVQYADLDHAQARGILKSDVEGRYSFRSVLPVPYAIPNDGPVGQMLDQAGRHPWRPAHLHFMITAPGYQTLITHVFREDSDYIDSDAVFGVRQSLICQWGLQNDGSYLLEYDFVLQSVASDGLATPVSQCETTT
ncbi:intradiol ring-cleavage dioxygenase [Paraburkholderia bannensis]|uniref:intradiol ring-cleavage dioxygenase n=1 Tax=Paraburkholderia bannensis TaxID=765414 RepID=UPI002AB75DE1|nr:intradiol ring-cleavage dioxygenase [Paraburkholderia bannensis]